MEHDGLLAVLALGPLCMQKPPALQQSEQQTTVPHQPSLPTWNSCSPGRPLGSWPGAKQVVHSVQAPGSAAQGGWSGGGQRVPLANWRQHCSMAGV